MERRTNDSFIDAVFLDKKKIKKKLKKLIKAKRADVNEVDKVLEMTALHIAVKRKDNKIVNFLLKNGADIEAKTGCGLTTLHLAVKIGKLSTVRLLLDCGAKVDAKIDGNINGKTSLYLAVENRLYGIVKLLLKRNASIRHSVFKGETLFQLAEKKNDEKMKELLLAQNREAARVIKVNDRFIRSKTQKEENLRITLLRKKYIENIKNAED